MSFLTNRMTGDGGAATPPPMNDYAKSHPHLFQMAGMAEKPGGFFSNAMWNAAQRMKAQGMFGDMDPAGMKSPQAPVMPERPDALHGALQGLSRGLTSMGNGAQPGMNLDPQMMTAVGGAAGDELQNFLGRMGIQF